MDRKVVLAHVGLLAVNLLYGGNYIVAKDLMPGVIGPSGFITLRILGSTLLFAVLFFFNPEKIQRQDYGRVLLCAIFGISANQLLFFNGLSLTSPINSSIIMTSTPILVLVASSILLKERITARKIAGISLGFLGAIGLILSNSKNAILASGIGDVMIFLNAMSYGIYLVLVTPLMKKYRATTIIFTLFFLGFFITLPFGYQQFAAFHFADLEPSHIFGLAYVVVGTTFFAYLLNIFSLKHVPPSVTSSYIYLQPIVATLAAILFFSWGLTNQNFNDINATKILCMLLVFTGVFLVSKKNKAQA